MSKYGVFIGRFQPFHNGHLAVVNDALSQVDKLIIVIGSANTAKNVKNPWSAAQRQKMIQACLGSWIKQDRYQFVWASDYTYNDNMWVSQIQNKIDEYTNGSDDVTLFGPNKDRTTFYLSLFPQWKSYNSLIVPGIDATSLRALYFSHDLPALTKHVPDPVLQELRLQTTSQEYIDLQGEFAHVAAYKEAWKVAPYAPTFVTTDAVVIKSGHVLVVRRKCQPGKGLLALPGGFLTQSEQIIDGCIRELKEETGLAISASDLKDRIVDQRVFDHPDRSLRGRTITHAFAFNLGSGVLPRVKGSDDAEKALWIPLREVASRGTEFFEDHVHICTYFSSKF